MTRMSARKRIALVAHDAMKPAIVAWARRNSEILSRHDLYGTGTTGGRIAEGTGLDVTRLKSGPLGGDQQLGAMIADDKLDVLIFFTDPLTAMPHDVDVKALTRIATLEQVVMACNAATADFIVASDMLDDDYTPVAEEAAHDR
ncbi:methylglyoxal synthase [Tropicimonas sp. TH_r6]|uniref:methylglyoxal synthase n=1 Tax=Tropicimonas sp. TH_r6 TaxID=3082085 RepID=UPI0029532BF1|nr:methylglyoxal synthase [Tropicimonas sp. TH_r6]MDV7142960.1 methylglyoxal synthase [Tropicimonas sp. TH_r6]